MKLNGEKRLCRALQERGQATRPQLAEALGLSLVRVNALLPRLLARGEATVVGRQASRGGRPVLLYRYEAAYAWTAQVDVQAEQGALLLRCRVLDAAGSLLRENEARYAHLSPVSVNTLLEGVDERRLSRIELRAPHGLSLRAQERELRRRFGCEVQRMSSALDIAVKSEGCLSLCLQVGQVPQGALWREGRAEATGDLGLLPLPADWAVMDYEDRALVEEMVARLIVCVLAVLAPPRVVLFAPFWTERLCTRVRYNVTRKLQGAAAGVFEFRHLEA